MMPKKYVCLNKFKNLEIDNLVITNYNVMIDGERIFSQASMFENCRISNVDIDSLYRQISFKNSDIEDMFIRSHGILMNDIKSLKDNTLLQINRYNIFVNDLNIEKITLQNIKIEKLTPHYSKFSRFEMSFKNSNLKMYSKNYLIDCLKVKTKIDEKIYKKLNNEFLIDVNLSNQTIYSKFF